MRTLFGVGSVALAVSLGLFACSGGEGSEVQGGHAGSSTTSGGSGNASAAGALNLSGSTTSGGAMTSGGSAGSGGIEECAAANQQAELSPVYLVFLLDESGSMGDGEHGQRAEKWDPVTAALNAFFSDPASSGITASLSLFPLNKNKTDGVATDKLPADCDAKAYVPPAVMPTALPNATAFSDLITSVTPPNEFGTPTFPALSGTIEYAKSLRAQAADRKVAIVMVTDGKPVACNGNTVQNTAAAAAAVADEIPTYVIGVGDSLDALNSIAESGGTDAAFIVEANGDADQMRQELLDAINLIRGQSISCEIDIPAPPAGKKLDPEKVDVQFTADGKPAASLKYGTTCTGDTAWRYDDAAQPTTIELCPDACSVVKGETKGKLDVVFGCTKRDVVN